MASVKLTFKTMSDSHLIKMMKNKCGESLIYHKQTCRTNLCDLYYLLLESRFGRELGGVCSTSGSSVASPFSKASKADVIRALAEVGVAGPTELRRFFSERVSGGEKMKDGIAATSHLATRQK